MAIEVTSDLSLVGTSQIVDGSVTSAKIGTGAVGSAALADNAVVAAKISAGAVGSAALASGAVVAAAIAAGSVGTVAISSGSATSGQILQANGSGAVTFETPAAGGGMTLIATATPSAASSLSFTSIPGTYKHLKLIWREVFQSSTGEWWQARFNNDSSALYSMQYLYFNGAVNQLGATSGDAGAARAFASIIPRTPDSASDLSRTSTGVLDIYRYTETGRKQYEYWTQGYSTAAAVVVKHFVAGVYGDGSTAAITSIDFIRSDVQTITGNFYLYGVS